MRHRSDDVLYRELRAAGAGSAEARELQGIAMQLGQLKTTPVKQHKHGWKLAVPIGLAAGAVALLLIVTLARGVLPGSPLYPVQKATDSVAIAVHPSYRATVMMRRAAQVETLVDTQAPSSTVMATLTDYQYQAKAYRAHYENYEVFEHCKDSLEQAASRASGPDRQAIDRTLAGLQDV